MKKIPKKADFGGHEIGKTYFCNYWRQRYTVLDIIGDYKHWSVRVRWENGTIDEHSTPADFEIAG